MTNHRTHRRPVATGLLALALGLSCLPADAQSSRARRDRDGAAANVQPAAPASPAAAPSFAPLPADHPLAAVWNDPVFVRRLVGSYGFESAVEPRLTPEELTVYRDQIVPLLRDRPRDAIPALQAAATPTASAVFDFTLGTVHFQLEDFTNAVVHFERALAKFPDYLRAERNLGLALVRDAKYAEAVGPLTRTLSLGGPDGRILGLLGFVHLQASRHVSAEAAYRQALIYEPDNLDFQLGLVKALLGLNQLAPAASMLDELLQRHPDRPDLWTLQANVFVQQEQPKKAIVNLEVLRRMDRATGAQLALLGDLYLLQENREMALSAYLAAVAKDGAQVPARGLRPAEILISRGAFTEAAALLEQLKSAGFTGNDELKLLRLQARVDLGSGRTEEGIRGLEEIARRNPLDGEALLLAGDHYARSGQPEKAQLRYEAAGRLEAYQADALLKQAQLRVQQQKYPEAVELLRRAQRIKPRDNVARYLEKVEQAALRARS